MACESCWGDAYVRSRMFGGSQYDHYLGLLAERADNPCPAEQDADAASSEASFRRNSFNHAAAGAGRQAIDGAPTDG